MYSLTYWSRIIFVCNRLFVVRRGFDLQVNFFFSLIPFLVVVVLLIFLTCGMHGSTHSFVDYNWSTNAAL